MTFLDNIRAIHNFYCINTNNLIEYSIFVENAQTMKKTFIFTLCSLFSMTVNAQNFSDYFEDKTLRADYIFTGDAKKQEVYLDELSSLPQWAGRKHHLAELPLAGNGEITMKDKATGETIYRTSFSSLFQEWVSEEEANRIKKGFENSFLLPYPKKEAIVTISLKDVYHKVNASLTHEIVPNDNFNPSTGNKPILPPSLTLPAKAEIPARL